MSELNGNMANQGMLGVNLEIAISGILRSFVVKIPQRLTDEWDIKKDVFRVGFNIPKGGKTKRQILWILSGIFDPLGILVSVTFVPQVWQNKHV